MLKPSTKSYDKFTTDELIDIMDQVAGGDDGDNSEHFTAEHHHHRSTTTSLNHENSAAIFHNDDDGRNSSPSSLYNSSLHDRAGSVSSPIIAASSSQTSPSLLCSQIPMKPNTKNRLIYALSLVIVLLGLAFITATLVMQREIAHLNQQLDQQHQQGQSSAPESGHTDPDADDSGIDTSDSNQGKNDSDDDHTHTTNAYARPLSVEGKWRYRSFFNLPQNEVSKEELVFARGTFDLSVLASDHSGSDTSGNSHTEPVSAPSSGSASLNVTGTLSGGDRNSHGSYWYLTVSGTQTPSSWNGRPSLSVELTAVGVEDTMSAGWKYIYMGQIVPNSWANDAVGDSDSTAHTSTNSDGGGSGGSNSNSNSNSNNNDINNADIGASEFYPAGVDVGVSGIGIRSWVGTVKRICCHHPIGLVASFSCTKARETVTRQNVLALPSSSSHTDSPESIPGTSIEAFINAVNLLKETPSTFKIIDKRTNATTSSITHSEDGNTDGGHAELNDDDDQYVYASVYDHFVYKHAVYAMSAHAGPAFLPWHRKFLFEFETALQEVSGDSSIAIPYWDWTDAASRMDVWAENIMGGNGTGDNGAIETGPFAHWKHTVNHDGELVNEPLRRAWGTPLGKNLSTLHPMNNTVPPILPNATELLSAMDINNFDSAPWSDHSHHPSSFRNTLEGWEEEGCHLHNTVHLWIGGHMRTVPVSANDPVFWLHHSFVDKIWSLWQERQIALAQAAIDETKKAAESNTTGTDTLTRDGDDDVCPAAVEDIDPSLLLSTYYLPITGAREGHNLRDAMAGLHSSTPEHMLDTGKWHYRYQRDDHLDDVFAWKE